MTKFTHLILLLSLSAGAAFAAGAPAEAGKTTAAPGHNCADCPMHKKAGVKKCSGRMCPEKLPGVETVSKNVPDGVEITMTARDEETIARVRELALVHYGNRETMGRDCPGRVEGAGSKIENTAGGVKVRITGKTPGTIKKIQEASAKEHMKAPAPKESGKEAVAPGKYLCPMGCPGGVSDKPGKCPKCGMPLEEKK